MKPFLISALILAGCGTVDWVRAIPVDFTPRPRDYEIDGVRLHQIGFRQGTHEILYRPSGGWECSGTPEGASLRLTGTVSTIRVEMKHRDNTPPVAFDEEGLKALRSRAQALLPAADKLTLETEVRGPVLINDKETMEYIYTGLLFARSYKFLVLLAPMGNEQFSFVLYSSEKEFDDASKDFIGSLMRLFWK